MDKDLQLEALNRLPTNLFVGVVTSLPIIAGSSSCWSWRLRCRCMMKYPKRYEKPMAKTLTRSEGDVECFPDVESYC